MSQESKGFNNAALVRGIEKFLFGLGLDLDNEHLRDTPERVARAWTETFGKGYLQKPEDVLTVRFDSKYTGLIVVKDIPFVSHCAHHLVTFAGKAKIGYLPNKRVTGLSKLARVLDIYACRLQVQEDLTREVAEALMNVLKPKGIGVVIEAEHQCMCYRGVMKPGSKTITSCLLGSVLKDRGLKQEFLNF